MTKSHVYAQVSTTQNKKSYSAITSKQWQVYYYMLSISLYNSTKREDHRYLYKDKFNISAAAKFLGISRTTIYKALDALRATRLVVPDDLNHLTYYKIYARDFVSISTETLRGLLRFSRQSNKNIDLLRTYLYLKRLNELKGEEKDFTKRDLISLLGHNINTPAEYEDIRNYLALLTYLSLIEIKTHTKHHEAFGYYTVYHLQNVFENSEHPDMTSDIDAEINGSQMPQRVYDAIKFTMPEVLD